MKRRKSKSGIKIKNGAYYINGHYIGSVALKALADDINKPKLRKGSWSIRGSIVKGNII